MLHGGFQRHAAAVEPPLPWPCSILFLTLSPTRPADLSNCSTGQHVAACSTPTTNVHQSKSLIPRPLRVTTTQFAALCITVYVAFICSISAVINPLTPRVKPWVIPSFLHLIIWREPLNLAIHWKAVEQYLTVVLFAFFNFTKFVNLENLSILDLALSRGTGLNQ